MDEAFQSAKRAQKVRSQGSGNTAALGTEWGAEARRGVLAALQLAACQQIQAAVHCLQCSSTSWQCRPLSQLGARSAAAPCRPGPARRCGAAPSSCTRWVGAAQAFVCQIFAVHNVSWKQSTASGAEFLHWVGGRCCLAGHSGVLHSRWLNIRLDPGLAIKAACCPTHVEAALIPQNDAALCRRTMPINALLPIAACTQVAALMRENAQPIADVLVKEVAKPAVDAYTGGCQTMCRFADRSVKVMCW